MIIVEKNLSSEEAKLCYSEFKYYHGIELIPDDYHPCNCYIPIKNFSIQQVNNFIEKAIEQLPQPISKDVIKKFSDDFVLGADNKVLIDKVPFGFIILRSSRKKKSILISVQHIIFEGDDYANSFRR